MNRRPSSSIKSYITHNNGCTPFKVVVRDNNRIKVYKEGGSSDDTIIDDNALFFNYIVLKINNYKRLYIGKDIISCDPAEDGNTILVKVKDNEYVHIGSTIYKFNPVDDIVAYYSPIGANDVPYPFAVGTLNTYLMIEDIYIPNSAFTTKAEPMYPYFHYYDHNNEFQNLDRGHKFEKEYILSK